MRLNTAPNDSRKNTKYYRFYSERIQDITQCNQSEYRKLHSVIRENTNYYGGETGDQDDYIPDQ